AQSAFIPDRGDRRLPFFHERKAQQRAALHCVAKCLAALIGFGNFLEFADGFFKQAHFAKRYSEIVVSFEVFVLRAHLAEFRAEFLENFFQWFVFSWRRRSFGPGCW